MAFKEKIKRFGSRVKGFWKEHWEEVVAVTGGVAITGLTCYGMYKLEQNRTEEGPLRSLSFFFGGQKCKK